MALRRSSIPAFAAALAALLALLGILAVGPVVVLLPALALGAYVLLERPGWATGIAIGAVVVVEAQSDWGPSSAPSRLYEVLGGLKLTPSEALLLLALVAIVLTRRARREPLLMPAPFVLPIALVLLGLLSGAITGHASGAPFSSVIDAGRTALPVALVPFMVVQVVRTREELERALAVAAGLAVFKGFAGIVALGSGTYAASVGQALTYFDAPANIVTMWFLVCVAGAAASRWWSLPRWVWIAWPFVLACLVLSYRRSFWIAAVLALALVTLLCLADGRWRFAVPGVAVIVVGGVLAFSGGDGKGLAAQSSGTEGSNGTNISLSQRLSSINPSSIASNVQDRYRIGERRNVWRNIRDSPISGVGLGVDYTQYYSLSIGNITRQYVHIGVLWWWMKLGILGMLAYVSLLLLGLRAGVTVWRNHPDLPARAFGVGSVASLVGYAVAETTGTFAGADQRASIVMGAIFGLLAAAHGQAREARLSARAAG